MLRNMGHHHQVGLEQDNKVLVVDDHPLEHIEPLEMPRDQAERDAALKAIHWMLDLIGPGGIVAKVLALRYIFHLEARSMDVVGRDYGLTRAAISKYCTMFADAMGVPALKSDTARSHYSRTQLKVWDTRPRHNATKPKGV